MSRLSTKARRARRWRRRYYAAEAKYRSFLATVEANPPRTGRDLAYVALLALAALSGVVVNAPAEAPAA